MATYINGSYQSKRRDKILVSAGETTPWYLVNPNGTSIVCAPGSGGTMVAQYSQDDPSVIAMDNSQGTSNAIAVPWPLGSVSANQGLQALQITAVRFSAITTAGSGMIAE